MMRTSVASTASQLHLIHVSRVLGSVSFYTESHQFIQKDSNNWSWDSSPFHHPLSLDSFFSPLELLKSFSHWTNNCRGVSAHIPAFLVYFYSLCSCFSVPHLCLLSCIAWWWKLFWYLAFCGEHERLHFSLQSNSPSSHLSQVNTDICSSCVELHGHWFHPAELLPFKWGDPYALWTSLLKPVYIQISEPILLILLDLPYHCWQMFFSLTSWHISILSWFLSLFLHRSNWMIILTSQLSVDFAVFGLLAFPYLPFFSNSPISNRTWFLCMLMTQSLVVLPSSPAVQI